MSEKQAIVRIENLTRGYKGQRVLFHEFDFSLQRGDFCFVVGNSGSGKTSLMKIITGEITPPPHSVYVQNDDVASMKGEDLQSLRRRIGVVYQDYKLLGDRSVFENIALPLELQDMHPQDIKDRVEMLVENFEFASKLHIKTSFLSGGEKQKVAIMRALIATPQCIFADEPTGNLDREASKMIADMFIKANQQGHTIIFITHDNTLIEYIHQNLPSARKVEIE